MYDISQAVAGLAGQRNAQQAQRQATGAQQQSAIIGGIGQGASGIVDWEARQKKQQQEDQHKAAVKSLAVKSYGFSPDDPILDDPVALAAEIDRRHADAGVKSHQEFLTKQQQTQNDAENQRIGLVPSGYGNVPPKYDINQDPYAQREMGVAGARTKADEEKSRLIGGEETDLGAPVDQSLSILGSAPENVGQRDVTEADVYSRAAKMKEAGKAPTSEALKGVLGSVQTKEKEKRLAAPRPVAPKADDEILSSEEATTMGHPDLANMPWGRAKVIIAQREQTKRTGMGVEGAKDRQTVSLKQQAEQFQKTFTQRQQSIDLDKKKFESQMSEVDKKAIALEQSAMSAAGQSLDEEAVAAAEARANKILDKYRGGAPAPQGGGSQPPGDPEKVKALQANGWTWDGTKWNEPK